MSNRSDAGLAVSLALIVVALGCGKGVDSSTEITVSESGLKVTGASPKWDDEDWPQWRGHASNGIASVETVPTAWSETENIAWSTDIPGRGHSSPTVVDGVVYLTTAIEEAEEQWILAYSLDDGTEKWRTKVHQGGFPRSGQMHGKSSHANATVACDGERIFTVFLNHNKVHVSAIDLNGDIAWQQTIGSFDSRFGYAPSPIIYKSALIVPADHQGGGYIAAVDRKTGDIVWRAPRPRESSYSSALIANVAGSDQLLICGCGLVASYDPNTGEKNWQAKATTSATCGTVVVDSDRVFASGGNPGSQTACVRADGSGDVVWTNRTKHYEPSLVVANGLLFGINDSGIANCWSTKTGEEQWSVRLRGGFSASPVVVDDLIYCPSLSGVTYVFRVTADGYQEVAQNQLGDANYASLTMSGNSILIRAVHDEAGGRVQRLHLIQ